MSDDWKLLDCDGDGVSNGQEIADKTDTQDNSKYNEASQAISGLTPDAEWNALDTDGMYLYLYIYIYITKLCGTIIINVTSL